MELPRLEFKHEIYDDGKNYITEGSYLSCAVQGKIYYKWKDVTYTQSRNDIPERMFIRGQELLSETYLEKFEIFDQYCQQNHDRVLVFMVCRQDLLITHKEILGTQVFFLGCILEQEGFIPSYAMIVKDPSLEHIVSSNGILMTPSYHEPYSLNIPAEIKNQETLVWVLEQQGSFIHTREGQPVTVFSAREFEVFNFFSNTQNNNQLFVRLFFQTLLSETDKKPKSMKDIESRLETIAAFSPYDKISHFVTMIEKFRILLEFFKNPEITNGIVRENIKIELSYDRDDEQTTLNMTKPEKSLKTFMDNIHHNLYQNMKNGKTKLSLVKQVKNAIFSFFKYDKNINNCCHILKHVEKLEKRRI